MVAGGQGGLGEMAPPTDALGGDMAQGSHRAGMVGGEGPTWHVAPDPGGGWRVERDGAQRASRVLATKREALAYAKDLARKRQDGRVMVHRSNGTFERQLVPGT